MYDFNRNEKDDESMIGFTIRTDGSMRTQHSKNDDYHKVDDYLQGIINKILYTEKDKYNLSQEVITQLEKEFNPKTKKNTNKVQSL
jgi:aminopeptidase-like protein